MAPTTVACGLSGGADSTALALLAADWAKLHGHTAGGIAVDHGLRKEAAEEAGYAA